METLELQTSLRSRTGKSGARSARREGKIPAVLYGPKRSTTPVLIDGREFAKKVATAEGSHLIRLRSADSDIEGRLALVKDVQRDPVADSVLHADFYEVDIHTKITVSVPLHFVGRAAGVELGGILQPIQREVEVLCLPTDIPEFLEVDVTRLGVHEAVHVSEIQAPPGVELQYDRDEPVVTVLPPTVEEVKVAAEGEAAPAEGAAAPAPEAAKGTA